jgi:hypothetical protein
VADIRIYQAVFHDGAIEVTYSEPRDETPNVILQRTIVVPAGLVPDSVTDVIDSLQEIVDAGLTDMQNPQIARRRTKGVTSVEVEDLGR